MFAVWGCTQNCEQQEPHMKSPSKLATTPPDELPFEEILRDHIARQRAKEMIATKIEPEKKIEPEHLIARSHQDRNRQR
jgi:hypothetical protein